MGRSYRNCARTPRSTAGYRPQPRQRAQRHLSGRAARPDARAHPPRPGPAARAAGGAAGGAAATSAAVAGVSVGVAVAAAAAVAVAAAAAQNDSTSGTTGTR